MLTAQPTLKNGRNLWNQQALPREEYEVRLVRLRQQMSIKELDLALVYGHGFNSKADPCYLSNYVIRLPQGALVAVPRQGEPAVFFEGAARGLPSMRLTTWIQDVRATADLAALCAKYAKEVASPGSSVALVGVRTQMPHLKYRAVRQALADYRLTDADDLVSALRRVKSERELARIREAGSVVATALGSIGGSKKQRTEQAIEAEARLAARLKGAEDVRILFARTVDRDESLRPAQNRVIAVGERLLIHVAAELDRYWAEATRTFIVTDLGLVKAEAGPLGPVYDAMLDSVVPGSKASAPVLAAQKAASTAHLQLDEQYGFGEGVGLSLEEAPLVSEHSTDVLHSGSAISLRLFSKDCGLMLGDTLIVTAGGAEVVTRI